MAPQPVRPFDQRHALGHGVLDAKLESVLRFFQTVEIEMPDVEIDCLVGLHQGEGWAWHFLVAARQFADQRPREGCLAGAQIALQRHHIARAQQVRQRRRQSGGGVKIGKRYGKPARIGGDNHKRFVAKRRFRVSGKICYSARMANDNECDVAIIGAGPVGLFAVFQFGMLGMKAHVVDTLGVAGGQCTALYPEKPIYDIPGYPRIVAADLVEKLTEQAAAVSPVYHLGQQVVALNRIEASGRWRLETSAGTVIHARVVVIAAGAGAFGPNRPPLPGIEDYEGKCVHYMVLRRQDFVGKRVVVAGGGDSAVDWAISLSEVAEKVSIVHRRPKFRAAPESVNRLHALADEGRIDLVVPYQLAGLEGDGERLDAVVVADLDGNRKRLEADTLLPFYGLAMSLGPIADWGLDIEQHHITVDQRTCLTSLAGVFAIGDIAAYPGKLKLILTGFAEAAMAAHAAWPLVFEGKALHFEYSTTKGLPDQ